MSGAIRSIGAADRLGMSDMEDTLSRIVWRPVDGRWASPRVPERLVRSGMHYRVGRCPSFRSGQLQRPVIFEKLEDAVLAKDFFQWRRLKWVGRVALRTLPRSEEVKAYWGGTPWGDDGAFSLSRNNKALIRKNPRIILAITLY